MQLETAECWHSAEPGGPRLVDILARHGVFAHGLSCADVHLMAQALGRSRWLAQAETRLIAEVGPPIEHTVRTNWPVVVLYTLVAAALAAACGFFGVILL